MTTQRTRLRVEIDTTGQQARVRALSGELNRLTEAGDNAARQTTALSSSIKLAGGAISGLIASVGIGQFVNDVAQLQDINSRITGLTGDLATSQEFLKRTAKELSAEYITLAGGYASLLPLYDAQVVSLRQVQQLTAGLANVQARTGASNAALGLSITGLSQALSAGVINYEDYKQIVEPLPGLNNKIALSFGKTSGELKDLISTGQLTSQEFGVKAIEAFKAYEGAAAALAGNLTQTFNRTKNAYTEIVEAFSEPVGNAGVAGAEALSAAMESVAANAGVITTAVQASAIAIGLAYSGKIVGAVGGYVAAQYAAVQASMALRAATVTQTQAALAEANVRVIQAQNTNLMAAADLRAAQAKALTIAGFRRLTFVAGELAVAERAAAAATAQLAAAQTAATASAAALVTAQRAATVSAGAMAFASRAASSALALIGGPTGAVVLAAAGVLYLATKQTDAEKSAKALSAAMKDLAADYKNNASAAGNSASATIQAQEANLIALQAQYDELTASQEKLKESVFGGRAFVAQQLALKSLSSQIESAKENLDEFRESNAKFSEGAALIKYSDRLEAALARAGKAATDASDTIREQLKKLFPDDEKEEGLKKLRDDLRSIQDVLSTSDFNRYSDEIDRQIAKLRENADAIRASEQAARDLQSALDSALPEQARVNEFNQQIDALDAGLKRGALSAIQYSLAVAGLQEQFDKPALDEARDKVEKLNEVLGYRVSTGFAEYTDEINLLNAALIEATDNSDLQDKIKLALANIDAEIRSELTIVESADNPEALQAAYRRQLDALADFHTERNVSEAAALNDIITLARSYADQAVEITERSTDRIRSFVDANSDIKIGVKFEADFQSARTQIFDTAGDSQKQKDQLLQLEAVYQEKLSELVRSGEATRNQVERASAADRFANFVNTNKEQISIAGQLASEVIGAFVDGQENSARKSSEYAQTLAQEAAAAQAEYRKNGTEQNRIAAEQAEKRALIADAAAKREFEQAKKAQIAQATISASLAIVNALASGGNALVGMGLAAVIAAQTARQIANIKRTQYNSAGSSASSSGSSTGAAYGGNSPTSNSQSTNAPTPQERTILIVAGNFRNEDDAMAEVARYQKRAYETGVIMNNPDGSPNFQNVPDRVVRLQ